jgi:hypothetical protein
VSGDIRRLTYADYLYEVGAEVVEHPNSTFNQALPVVRIRPEPGEDVVLCPGDLRELSAALDDADVSMEEEDAIMGQWFHEREGGRS